MKTNLNDPFKSLISWLLHDLIKKNDISKKKIDWAAKASAQILSLSISTPKSITYQWGVIFGI